MTSLHIGMAFGVLIGTIPGFFIGYHAARKFWRGKLEEVMKW